MALIGPINVKYVSVSKITFWEAYKFSSKNFVGLEGLPFFIENFS